MRRRSRAGGDAVKARRRKTVRLKRDKGPIATRHYGPSAADLRKQLEQRTRELAEAREQQTATSEVLRVCCAAAKRREGPISDIARKMKKAANRGGISYMHCDVGKHPGDSVSIDKSDF
jgi:hypothetical protein